MPLSTFYLATTVSRSIETLVHFLQSTLGRTPLTWNVLTFQSRRKWPANDSRQRWRRREAKFDLFLFLSRSWASQQPTNKRSRARKASVHRIHHFTSRIACKFFQWLSLSLQKRTNCPLPQSMLPQSFDCTIAYSVMKPLIHQLLSFGTLRATVRRIIGSLRVSHAAHLKLGVTTPSAFPLVPPIAEGCRIGNVSRLWDSQLWSCLANSLSLTRARMDHSTRTDSPISDAPTITVCVTCYLCRNIAPKCIRSPYYPRHVCLSD